MNIIDAEATLLGHVRTSLASFGERVAESSAPGSRHEIGSWIVTDTGSLIQLNNWQGQFAIGDIRNMGLAILRVTSAYARFNLDWRFHWRQHFDTWYPVLLLPRPDAYRMPINPGPAPR